MLREENTPEAQMREENVEQLIAFMTEFSDTREEATLEAFLEEIALMSPMDETEGNGNAITLMTLHSAKGLEYPVVFMCGMEENLFPTARSVEESRRDPQAIEEERRLCYVGITRARERLYLTYTNRRYAYGNMIDCDPSRFLQEIPDELFSVKREVVDFNPRTRKPGQARFGTSSQRESNRPGAAGAEKVVEKKKPKGVHYEWDTPQQASEDLFSDLVDQDDFLAVGQWVRHASWGKGQIVARDGQGENMKLSRSIWSPRKKSCCSLCPIGTGPARAAPLSTRIFLAAGRGKRLPLTPTACPSRSFRLTADLYLNTRSIT